MPNMAGQPPVNTMLATTPLGEWPKWLRPSEVAALFRVDAKTASRWAASGKFKEEEVMKTPGGHFRISKAGAWRVFTTTYLKEE